MSEHAVLALLSPESRIDSTPAEMVLQRCKLKKDDRPLKAVLRLECEPCNDLQLGELPLAYEIV